MGDIKHESKVLEAINFLREGKNRPDASRICHYMQRRFSVPEKEALADLQKCVDRDIVFKAQYKGYISYRIFAKSRYGRTSDATSDSSPGGSDDKQIVRFPKNRLSTQISAIIRDQGSGLGIQYKELLELLSVRNPSCPKRYLMSIVKKGLTDGSLKRLSNGSVAKNATRRTNRVKTETESSFKPISVVNKTNKKTAASPKIRKKPGRKPKSEAAQTLIPIVDGRNKRAKKVRKMFDPSNDNSINAIIQTASSESHNSRRRKPRKHRFTRIKRTASRRFLRKNSATLTEKPTIETGTVVSDASSEMQVHDAATAGGVCCVCREDSQDRLISCAECSNKAHPDCLLTAANGLLRINAESNTWLCPHCKTCVVCEETSEAGMLTVCTICCDAYHQTCHSPRILDSDNGSSRWTCSNCHISEEPDEITETALDLITINSDTSNVGEVIYKQENDAVQPSKTKIKREMSTESITIEEEVMPFRSVRDNSTKTYAKCVRKANRKDDFAANCENKRTLYKDAVVVRGLTGLPVKSTPSVDSYSDEEHGIKSESPAAEQDFEYNTDDEKVDPSIPNALKWTYKDVFRYFVEFFPDYADVFLKEEVDGLALLLMTRDDVFQHLLRSVRLPFGVAMHMYERILMLQQRRNEPYFF